jgi:hypothetical protein
MGEPLTKEEFAAAYNAASPRKQAIIREALLKMVAEQNGPPPDQSA